MYAVVEMFVCGGFSTCLSVWLGAVKRVRKRRSDAGRHFWNAPPVGAAAAAVAPEPPPKPLPPPPPFCCVCGPPSVTPSFCEAGLHLREVLRRVGRGRFRWIWNVFACVFSVATIFGTMPS